MMATTPTAAIFGFRAAVKPMSSMDSVSQVEGGFGKRRIVLEPGQAQAEKEIRPVCHPRVSIGRIRAVFIPEHLPDLKLVTELVNKWQMGFKV